MSTTFIHIGDFHARPDARNADRYRALEQIQRAIETMPQIGAVLWPGDLNDSRMSIEDRNRLAEFLIDIARIAPVVICYGNHDMPGDLDVFGHLRSGHPVYVVARPTTLRLRLATGEFASIFVLPYPTKAGLAAAGVAKGDVVDTAADLLEPVFMHAAIELADARKAGDLTLMIGHVNVAGSLTSVGQPNIGHEIELSPRHLDRLGTIPKLLNHIHKAQQIAGAYYAGSVCRLNWGEVEPKQFNSIVHFADAGGEWGIFHHPIDVAPMYHVDGILTREGFTYQTTAGPGGAATEKPASWKGCEVRVRVKFSQSDKNSLAFAPVHAEFAEAKRFELEPIAVPDRALRAPEVQTARTVPEKLAAFCQRLLTDTERAKLAALETKDPVQVLAEVDAMLDAREAETQAVAV